MENVMNMSKGMVGLSEEEMMEVDGGAFAMDTGLLGGIISGILEEKARRRIAAKKSREEKVYSKPNPSLPSL